MTRGYRNDHRNRTIEQQTSSSAREIQRLILCFLASPLPWTSIPNAVSLCPTVDDIHPALPIKRNIPYVP